MVKNKDMHGEFEAFANRVPIGDYNYLQCIVCEQHLTSIPIPRILICTYVYQ